MAVSEYFCITLYSIAWCGLSWITYRGPQTTMVDSMNRLPNMLWRLTVPQTIKSRACLISYIIQRCRMILISWWLWYATGQSFFKRLCTRRSSFVAWAVYFRLEHYITPLEDFPIVYRKLLYSAGEFLNLFLSWTSPKLPIAPRLQLHSSVHWTA